MSKREKFIELAESRVTKTINHLKLIGNLSNRSHYEYYKNDINKIFKRLKTELKNAEEKFLVNFKNNNFKL